MLHSRRIDEVARNSAQSENRALVNAPRGPAKSGRGIKVEAAAALRAMTRRFAPQP